MQGTLLEGDRIIVSKLVYGPRLPITPLSIPFTEKGIYLDWIEMPYTRIPGYDRVRRNDVLVFNLPSENYLPIDQRKRYIKRCVALPGDTVFITDGEVRINHHCLQEKKTILRRYEIELKSGTDGESFFRSFGIAPPYKTADKIHYIISADENQLNQLKSSGKIIFSNQLIAKKNYFDPQLFPGGPNYKWNEDQYGPLIIPRKGNQTKLNPDNICLYKNLIEDCGDSVSVKNGMVYINGKETKTYTFTQDYFFVLGDNRSVSEDSRYWGFLPESHLIGKATWIISGKEDNRSWRSID